MQKGRQEGHTKVKRRKEEDGWMDGWEILHINISYLTRSYCIDISY